MPSFDIEVKETIYTTVSITAKDLEEALAKLDDMRDNDEFVAGVTHQINDYEVEYIPLEGD